MTANAQTTANDHPVTAERFERVLVLYCGVIDAVKAASVTDKVELQYINGINALLLNYAIAALELAREPRTVFGSQPQLQLKVPLAFPLAVIARAAIESYNALFHAFLNPDAYLRETMKLFFRYEGFRRRAELGAYIVEHQEKQRHEIQQMQRLKPLLDLRNPPPLKLIRDQLPLAGFGEQTALELYGNLSHYAHGGYIAVLQGGQSSEESMRRRLRTDLASVALALTMTMHRLGDRLQVARDFIDADPSRAHEILFFNYFARTSDHGARKALLLERGLVGHGRVVTWEAQPHTNAVPEEHKIAFEGTSEEAWDHFALEAGEQDLCFERPQGWRQAIRWQPWT